jgi:acetyl esterase/lipase
MKNMKTKRYVFKKMALCLVLSYLLHPVYLFAQAAVQEIRISTNIEYSIAVNHKKRTESLLLDIYQLPKVNQTKRPVIILVHGGGFGGGDKGFTQFQGSFYPDMAKAFALDGFVSFSINYRLWPDCPADSFHIELENAVSDVLEAVKWIKSKSVDYGIDTAKIIIGGDSAGGGLVVNVAYCNAQLFLACIDMWGGLPPYGMSGAHGNPVYRCEVGKKTPPTCLIHGTDDDVVPYSVSEDLAATLVKKGIYNELHPLPGCQHYPVEQIDKIIKIIFKFTDKVLSDKL